MVEERRSSEVLSTNNDGPVYHALSSIRSAVSIEHRLVTDRHGLMASTADAKRVVRVKMDYSLPFATSLAATGTHMPYGITHVLLGE